MNSKGIKVRIFNLESGLVEYEDVKFIRVISKDYNLLIMKDYLPIIGEIQGEIQIGREKEDINMEKVRGYFMHKHNKFNLFYSD